MRPTFRSSSRVLAVVATLSLVGLVGCGSKKSTTSSSTGRNTDCPETSPAPKSAPVDLIPHDQVKAGGTVTYAAEQEPTGWNVQTGTDNQAALGRLVTMVLPQPFVVQPDFSVRVNSDVLTSAEQTKDDPQTIVLKINPEAEWNDGTPISADDFVYNWQMQNGSISNVDAASTTGYQNIESVTGSDDGKTVTIVFKTPYPDWKGLFPNMLPAHILEDASGWGTLDKDGNAAGPLHDAPAPTFSGGPFKFQNYQPHKSVEMVPNEAYWGTKPKLDKIIVRFDVTNPGLAAAFQNSEVGLAYPQPQLDLVQNLKKISGVNTVVNWGLEFEHLDMNLGNPMLALKPVRKAIYYGLNRYELVRRTVGQFDKQAVPLENRMWVNNQSEYEAHADACKDFDPAKAEKFLTAAGFEKGSDGIYAKDGKRLSFNIVTTGGNALREQTEQIISDQLHKIGIEVKIANKPGSDAFEPITTKKYDLALFAWVAGPFPTQNQSIYASDGGQNWTNYSNPELDKVLSEMVSTSDTSKEVSLSQQADKILWEDVPTIPLYQKPTLLAHDADIVNVVDDASTQGPLWNANDWGLGKAS